MNSIRKKMDASIAAEKLGIQRGKWADVWERFKEKPGAYPQIPRLLRICKLPNTGCPIPIHGLKSMMPGRKNFHWHLLVLIDRSPDNARIQIAELGKDSCPAQDMDLGRDG